MPLISHIYNTIHSIQEINCEIFDLHFLKNSTFFIFFWNVKVNSPRGFNEMNLDNFRRLL